MYCSFLVDIDLLLQKHITLGSFINNFSLCFVKNLQHSEMFQLMFQISLNIIFYIKHQSLSYGDILLIEVMNFVLNTM